MELYTNSVDRTVYLDVPVIANQGTMEVTVYDGDVVVFTGTTVVYDDGRYSTVLPFFLVQTDKQLKVNWKFNYSEGGATYEYDDFQEINIVTPIIPLAKVKEIIENDDDDAAATVEKAVRYIIQSHTGQSFGKYVGVKGVTGSGENSIRLPARLIKLETINGTQLLNSALAIRGNGWFLRGRSAGVPTLRADWDGWHENPYTTSVPLSAPTRAARTLFVENSEYEINGTWGWNSVPAAVQEAAKLLINDYACGDTNYRDRFLTSMTAADWRIQFHDGAFANTGNVRANQLLAEFKLFRGWTVI